MTELAESTLTPPPQPISLIGRVKKLTRSRAVWVLADQGIVSIGNFLTGNLLARKLAQDHYGAFGIMLETMFLLNSLQAGLINYPLTVEGAREGRVRLRRLAGASLMFTLAIAPLLGGIMFFAGVSATPATSHILVIGANVALAMLLWQMQETVRRALMADLRFADAIWGDAVSYLGQTLVIVALSLSGKLTLTGALASIWITSAAALLIQAAQVGVTRVPRGELRQLARDFWRLGKWSMLSNLMSAITGASFMWTLKGVYGLAVSGTLFAIIAVFKLANPLMSSVTSLIIPAVARAKQSSGMKAASRAALRYGIFGAALLAPYFLVLAIFPATSVRVIYGPHSPYIASAWLLRMYVLQYAMVYVNWTISAWLGGLGESRSNFHGQLVNMIATLIIGLPLVYRFALTGMVVGGVLSTTFNAIACGYLLRKAIHRLSVNRQAAAL